ncbi:MAG: hypothetical protein ACI9KE_005279 [Polyangiales bacterium]|jgi:uncharacterized protein (TIGR02453 family)
MRAMAARKKTPTFKQFQGFPKEGLEFLKELEKNNKREWFVANKARYEEHVLAHLKAVVEEGEKAYGNGKNFRIHRDVRFSKDKTPSKTHASAVFERKGIVHYLHIEKDHMFAATGCYQMAKDQLARFYEAIDDDKSGKRLEKLVADAEKAGLEVGGSALKTAPRGYAKDHTRIALLRHKGLTTSRQYKAGTWMHGPELAKRMVKTFAEGEAINEWLRKHVGESAEGKRFVKN